MSLAHPRDHSLRKLSSHAIHAFYRETYWFAFPPTANTDGVESPVKKIRTSIAAILNVYFRMLSNWQPADEPDAGCGRISRK